MQNPELVPALEVPLGAPRDPKGHLKPPLAGLFLKGHFSFHFTSFLCVSFFLSFSFFLKLNLFSILSLGFFINFLWKKNQNKEERKKERKKEREKMKTKKEKHRNEMK